MYYHFRKQREALALSGLLSDNTRVEVVCLFLKKKTAIYSIKFYRPSIVIDCMKVKFLLRVNFVQKCSVTLPYMVNCTKMNI